MVNKSRNKTPVLELSGLSVVYKRVGRPALRAVNKVSLSLPAGGSLGIVGESGCGKSSLARVIMGLHPPHEGALLFEGRSIAIFTRAQRVQYRRRVQMIFQDATGSLNPRMTVRQSLEEVLRVHRICAAKEIESRVDSLLERVALSKKILDSYPREMSGGQCQRVSIARCLALGPEVIIADEPVSALDVSVQARILNLLLKLQQELNLALILISHDLAVVKHVCDEAVVMYAGEFVEVGCTLDVLENPQHAYTKSLLAAVPDVKRALRKQAVIKL
ncbi:MAG: ATP-binding cassette domain-containing protein [Kiritimatiellae bacterium]|nr:ATP-binding cassette domain-containing protein [Kiritimatiellia bacterium]